MRAAYLKNFGAAFFLGALCLLVYANSLHHNFMIDDYLVVLQDHKVNNIKYFFDHFIPGQRFSGDYAPYMYYRPLAHITVLFNRLMFGDNPFGYHLVNLLLFYCCVLSLYFLSNVLLQNRQASFIAALLFAVHPFYGMLVNYISATHYSLMLLAMNLSMAALLISEEAKNRRLLRFLSVAFFIIALLCHEVAMALPFYLMAALFFIKRYSFRKIAKTCLPHMIILALYFLLRMKYVSFNKFIFGQIPGFDMSLGNYLATFTTLILWVLEKLVFLKGIVLIWVAPIVRQDLWLWNGILAAMLLLFFWILFHYRKWGKEAFLLSWFAMGFAPVAFACFFKLGDGLTLEPHWIFFPALAFFLYLGLIFQRLSKVTKPALWMIALAVLLGAYFFHSQRYNRLWADEETYCRYWEKTVPGFKRPVFFMAMAYMNKGEYALAKHYFKQSFYGDPSDWQIYCNLGLIESGQGFYKEAVENFIKAAQLNPYSAKIYMNSGIMYLRLGLVETAEEMFLRALGLNPYSTVSRFYLAKIFSAEGRIEEAIRLCEENLRIDSRDGKTAELLSELKSRWQKKQF